MFADSLFTEQAGHVARVFPAGVLNLPEELRTAFSNHARRFTEHGTLLLEGEECRVIYCVLDGWLALSKALDQGQEQIIDFALPGDIVDPAAADGVTSSVTIQGLTDGTGAAMPAAIWERMNRDRPDLHRIVHRMEAAGQARRAERMLRLGRGTAEMRVAYALLEFCIRLRATCDAERRPEFHIPLTQQELGDYVGLSSVHVCRTMRRMSRNGILEMHDHMDIRILDAPSLARLAGVDIEDLKREIVPARK